MVGSECEPHLTNKYGETPLHIAAQTGCLGNVRFLISCNIDPFVKTQYGYDAKAIAKQFGRRRIEESLQTYEDRYRLNEMDDESYRERLDKIREQMSNPIV